MPLTDEEKEELYAEHVQEVGIWPPYEAFYLQAILFHTHSVILSREYLDSLEDDHSNLEVMDFFQTVVLHAASISRYFWPTSWRQKTEKNGLLIRQRRAAKLRDFYKVDENSALYSRNLRNDIEHFDERIDEFVTKFMGGRILPEFVGSYEGVEGSNYFPMRGYDPETGELYMFENSTTIEPLLEELARIHELTVAALEKGARIIVDE